MPLSRHISLREDRGDRASRDARVTVSAACGVDVHLLVVRSTLDAINWANIDARQILRADARLTNHVGQTSGSPRVIVCSSLRSFV